jgi:shikimate dehydrogenase
VTPRRFAVIGDPIAHSLSPVMHGAALAALRLPHTYEAIRVPHDALPRTLDRLRRGELHGLNVTVPHKVEAMSLCDVTTDEAHATFAVNTLWMDPTGRLVGTNTDVDGLVADFAHESIAPTNVLILGAGGAARAVVAAARRAGAREIVVAARREEQARALVADMPPARASTFDALVPPMCRGLEFDLVVNATSAGMAGGGDGAPIADAFARAPRTPSAVAYDLVYRPPAGAATTLFLQRASSLGHRAIDGVDMLVEQGARALSIFTSIPIDREIRAVMRSAVERALGR